MNNTNEHSFTTQLLTLGLALTLVIGFAYYLFPKGQKDTATTKTIVQIEEEKLRILKERQAAEKEALKRVEEQYNLLRNLVIKSTDIFFKDAESNNPKFIINIKDEDTRKDIIEKRRKITELFKKFDEKFKNLNDKSGLNSLERLSTIINGANYDSAFIKEYILKLEEIMNGVTTSNSNLTQNQIDSYKNVVQSSLNNVEGTINTIKEIEKDIEEIYNPGSTTGNTSNPNDNTPINPTPYIVTDPEVHEQEEIVNGPTTPEPTPLPPPPPPTSVKEIYTYFEGGSTIGAQTLIEYLQSLPGPKIDKTGWPDIFNNVDTKPLFK